MGALAFIGGSVGAGELIVVFVVALVLFGSKKLPSIARTIGRAVGEFRRAAQDFSDDLMYADQSDEVESLMEKFEQQDARPDEEPDDRIPDIEDQNAEKA
ncbi:MAG: twin-arginine translocase TatA/TatE family subunit [Lentisphaerae bacterium]|nr:twin-arginine translocase TatA/TatE family subunit [Lentisphaerota bacterium]